MVACTEKPGVKYKILVTSNAPRSRVQNEAAALSSEEPCSPRMQRIRGGVLQNEVDASPKTEGVSTNELRGVHSSRVRSPRAEADRKLRATRMVQSETSRRSSSEFLAMRASPMHQRRRASPTSELTMKARTPSLSVETEIRRAKDAILATDRRLRAIRTTSGTDTDDSLSQRKSSSVAEEIEEARSRLSANRYARTGNALLAQLLPEVQSATHTAGGRRSSAVTFIGRGTTSISPSTSGSPSPRTSFVGHAGVSLSWSPS
eukprot:COSAG02_NODE_1262_length_13556_cov_11.011522_12_plen_261_part_00